MLRGGDTLLERAHLGGEGWLVTYGGRHTSEKCGDLGTCLRETEDVVDEEEDVTAGTLAVAVAEALCHSKTRESDTGTCSRRLVHLTEDHCALRLREGFVVYFAKIPFTFLHALFESLAIVDDAALNHLTEKVVALTGTFADAGEDGEAVVTFSDVVYKLLNKDSLADACAAEETDLTALGVRLDKVDNLDACEEDLALGGQLLVGRGWLVDWAAAILFGCWHAVDSLTDDVEESTSRVLAVRHHDWGAGGDGVHAAAETIGGLHGYASDGVLANVLLALGDEGIAVVACDFQGIVNLWKSVLGGVESDVYHRADYLDDLAFLCHIMCMMWGLIICLV